MKNTSAMKSPSVWITRPRSEWARTRLLTSSSTDQTSEWVGRTSKVTHRVPTNKIMDTPKTDDETLLSLPTCSRFRLEERSGIVAIYDTQHPEYMDTTGCHADYPWVVCLWSGRYVTPPDPECLNGCGHWTVEKRWIEKAHQTLELLNSLCANKHICHPCQDTAVSN